MNLGHGNEHLPAAGRAACDRQPHGPRLRTADRRRGDPGPRPAPDQGLRRRLRAALLRPGLHEHGELPQRDHLHRRGEGDPALPGLPIEELAERVPFLDVASLLINGELPGKRESAAWADEITQHTFVHENVKKFIDGFHHDAHPMGILVSTIAALSTFYPGAKEISDTERR